jgi:predicted acyl esterase
MGKVKVRTIHPKQQVFHHRHTETAELRAPESDRTSIYHGDELRPRLRDYKPSAQAVPYGSDVQGTFFDGYPQLIKQESSQPVHSVKVEKDVTITLRDGVRILTDVYRPDVTGKKFPAILSYFFWGKDVQEVTRWLPEQDYWDTPFWDGSLETGAIDYFVERGYARVIPEPRNFGRSEGSTHPTAEDTYDVIEWIARQPWCDGNVGMIGACGYAGMQTDIAASNPPPSLKAIVPFEAIIGTGENFHGIFECMQMNVLTARHGNDHLMPDRHSFPPLAILDNLSQEELQGRIDELLNHPDIKYNPRFYAILKYPKTFPIVFAELLELLHPRPVTRFIEQIIPDYGNIKLPIYISTPWNEQLYTWQVHEIWAKLGSKNRKLALWPSKAPGRPFVAYSDEMLRFHDYWLKGVDNGIMEEPPVKLFVMGANKWRFENEWPLARTAWTKFYLHPRGGLSEEQVDGSPDPERFTQPAPYLDPGVYCLTYSTEPLEEDLEITGPMALYLEAAIDKTETNWMVDIADVDEKGNKMLVSNGYLAAEHRALDMEKSLPYQPIHPRQDPEPVTPGEVIEYAIAIKPGSCLFKKGHRMQLIIRNQDDLLSRLGIWGVYMLPHMETVKHDIHFGKSHLLLPVIPAARKQSRDRV